MGKLGRASSTKKIFKERDLNKRPSESPTTNKRKTPALLLILINLIKLPSLYRFIYLHEEKGDFFLRLHN